MKLLIQIIACLGLRLWVSMCWGATNKNALRARIIFRRSESQSCLGCSRA